MCADNPAKLELEGKIERLVMALAGMQRSIRIGDRLLSRKADLHADRIGAQDLLALEREHARAYINLDDRAGELRRDVRAGLQRTSEPPVAIQQTSLVLEDDSSADPASGEKGDTGEAQDGKRKILHCSLP